ncbi:MAG: alpha/beta fold hydrolase [Bacteroidetes bacterium]|nr:MAG: alpha/beta fold hydrolase [Bacteroidota bacterium]
MEKETNQETNYPIWLDRNEYPFTSHFFDLPVGKMHYIDEGQGDPIVMIHGNPGWSFEFRNIIKELSKTNRCIAIDHIGFGLSDKPFDFDYLPSSQAKNFEIFMDSLNLNNIAMTFNDWGGPIGLSYAIKHPEIIKKLVIMNTFLWSVEDDPHYQKFSGLMGGGFGRFMIKNFNLFAHFFLPKVFGEKKNLPKHIHKHYYKHLATRKDRKGCYTFPKHIIASSKWLDSLWQQRERINSIPTTFVWGMKDIAFREKELNYWIENWKNPKVVRLEGVGHYPQEESPNDVINSLRG